MRETQERVLFTALAVTFRFDWVMASDNNRKWQYSREDLDQTPSRKDGIDADKELGYRQQAANLIQDMGQRLSVNQLTINTAIVYMHRFYVYHSFTVFSRYAIAPTALFLAAKVEEQPKKLEHVLKICYVCLHPDKPHLDTHSDSYLKQAQELVQNELVLLQTLGFDISVDHPHTHVVKCTQLVKASRDLSQMAYFMATNSLHLTTFCLLYKPTVVAAMCIHLSCKWSKYEIPLSNDGKAYWTYMDPIITEPLLDTIIEEFLKILNRCPTRLRKLKNYKPSLTASSSNKETYEFSEKDVKHHPSSNTPVSAGEKPENNHPPPKLKEKKPAMSLQEYKRTHPNTRVPTKPAPPTQPVHSSSGHTKPVESRNNQNPMDPSRSTLPQSRPHPHQQPHPSSRAPPQKPDLNRSHNRPTAHPEAHRNMMKPQQPPNEKKPDQSKGWHQAPHSQQPKQPKPEPSSTPDDLAAVNKDLEGRIRTEKLKQRAAPESHHNRSATHSGVTSSGRHLPKDAQEARRHHSEKTHAAHSHSQKESKALDYKAMCELYKRNPEKLHHYLKQKAAAVALSTEEKNLLGKLRAKEEERRKRKQAEAALKHQQQKSTRPPPPPPPAAATAASSEASVAPLRIKLSSSDGQLNTSVAKIVGSSSGSGSEVSPVRARKRGHLDSGGQVEHSAAKLSKRGHHHHHSGNGSSSGGSKHKHHHQHRHHSKSSKKHSEILNDAIFQKSLSDAISKSHMQVKQTSGKSIPTVTLKRAANGSGPPVFTPMPNTAMFDPSAPIPMSMPDEIFEDEEDSGAFVAGSLPTGGSYDSARSSPEPGEINESPPHRPKQPAKVPGLMSPSSGSDTKLHRGYGYHSNNEKDFSSPPPLVQRSTVN
uniref:cyclin-T2 isoform X2 n=1 Tax=Ciona intestinalis TaxID=7719 RepID=UPI000521324F|nr:cyclin-T2 isoform X2 [Ciona intestinalis]|eukprot:XP_009858975.1 cyclin-T2 isoform X2 [Ciona intestinalis]